MITACRCNCNPYCGCHCHIKWISVLNRLPEIGEKILVYGGGDIHKGRRVPDEEINKSGTIFMSSTDGGTLVSHWMPLPKPPDHK